MAIMDRSLEQELLAWKNSEPHYPLILRGARQVGKTYLIEKFGKSAFSSFASVNFEAQPEAIACFESLDPEEILMRLQVILDRPIEIGKTLLFLDEIQACPQAIRSMRYFKEKLPKLHLIGAGSLLEFALIQGKFSFPVGRVQFMYLNPLSFHEYLLARGKAEEVDQLLHCSIDQPPDADLHREMIKCAKEYFLVGGMPAAVSTFCHNFSLKDVSRIHEILLSTYQADFSKYATVSEQKYLKIVFYGMFQLVAQQFKYSKIDAHIRSRELKQALDHLEWAGLINPIYASSASGLPLSAHMKRNKFKILALDIGLLQHALKIDPEIIFNENFMQNNRGPITEQFVGQELLAYADPHMKESLYYWQREKKGSDAEVDYLFTIAGTIVPLEVKAGMSGRLKSLHQFIKEKRSPIGVQISQGPLSFENGILRLPFYLIEQFPKILTHLIKSTS